MKSCERKNIFFCFVWVNTKSCKLRATTTGNAGGWASLWDGTKSNIKRDATCRRVPMQSPHDPQSKLLMSNFLSSFARSSRRQSTRRKTKNKIESCFVPFAFSRSPHLASSGSERVCVVRQCIRKLTVKTPIYHQSKCDGNRELAAGEMTRSCQNNEVQDAPARWFLCGGKTHAGRGCRCCF